jgi:hypothetical protein
MEMQVDSLSTPAEAETLLGMVTEAKDAFRIQRVAEDRGEQWRAVALCAERLYGQLLGPAKPGNPGGKPNLSGTKVSGAESVARNQARKVAAVPEDLFKNYLNNAPNPSRAGLMRRYNLNAGGPNPPRPPRPTKATEEQINACLEGIRRGESQTDIGRELGLGNNSMVLAQAYGIAADRHARAVGPPVRPPGRPKNWNGKSNDKRQRELSAARGKDNYAELLEFQTRVAQMCVVLEDWHVIEDCQLDEVALQRLSDIHDDLLSLGEWYERTLSAVQHRLTDAAVLQKIGKLRDTSGRTPEEAQTAMRLAERLERKLGSRLAAV